MKNDSSFKGMSGIFLALPMAAMIGCVDRTPMETDVPDAKGDGVEKNMIQEVRSQPILGQVELTSKDPATGLIYIKDPVTSERFLLNPNWEKPATGIQGLRKSAAGATQGTWLDASGQVEITLYTSSVQAAWDAAKEARIANVATQVENDRVLVGGGAYADYSGGAGAFITKSYPNDGALTTWSAQSKDHGAGSNHTLYVYAIGLRLKDNSGNWIPSESLRTYMTFASNTSAPSTAASTRVQNNVNYWTIGGGANIQWTTKAQLLLDSHPDDAQPGWYAASKSHRTTELCPITAYAIGITKGPIPNFGYVAIRQSTTSPIQYYIKSPGTYVSAGASPDHLDSEPGWATTCMGAKAGFNNNRGRLITRMSLDYQDNLRLRAWADAKDHFVNEAGTTWTYLCEIKKQ